MKMKLPLTTWEHMVSMRQVVPESQPFRHWQLVTDIPNSDFIQKCMSLHKGHVVESLTPVSSLAASWINIVRIVQCARGHRLRHVSV